MKFYKNNENRRSILSESFLSRMVQMRRCFFLKCTKGVHEEKNIKQMSRYAQETGRSMVEMLGVLAIIGVLSVGGIAGYSKAMFKHKMTKFNDQLTTLVTNIYLAFENEKDFGAIQYGVLPKLNVYPEGMYKNGIPYHVFGNILQIQVSSTSVLDGYHPDYGYPIYKSGDTNQAFFSITALGLSPEACTSLLMTDWGSNSGMYGMGAGTASASDNNSSGPNVDSYEKYARHDNSEYSLPFTIDRAAKICSETENPQGYVFWYFVK